MLYSFGANACGQLSLGHTKDTYEPTTSTKYPLDYLHDTTNVPLLITGGANHTLLVTRNGKLLVCGDNRRGQLGLGSHHTTHDDYIHELTQIKSFKDIQITHASAGWEHSAVIDSRGRLYTFGCNKYSQCGISSGDGTSRQTIDTPTQVIISTNSQQSPQFIKSACGLKFTIALTTDGRVFGFGSNRHGELCRLNTSDTSIIKQPTMLLDDDTIVHDIAAGSNHIVLSATTPHEHDNGRTGMLLLAGRNRYGQLGVDPSQMKQTHIPVRIIPSSSVKSVHAGWHFSCYLDTNGDLYTFGRNDHYQLSRGHQDMGTTEEVNMDIHSEQTTTISTTPTHTPLHSHLPPLTNLSTGSEHVVSLTHKHQVLSWGWNEHGNCGCRDMDVGRDGPYVVQVEGVPVVVGCGYGFSFVWCTRDSSSENGLQSGDVG